jgi:hypothetical protein
MPQYIARVTGELWSEEKAAMDYTYEALNDALAIARAATSGDFSSVDDYELVKHATAPCGHADTVVVRPFATEEGEDQYVSCMFPPSEEGG